MREGKTHAKFPRRRDVRNARWWTTEPPRCANTASKWKVNKAISSDHSWFFLLSSSLFLLQLDGIDFDHWKSLFECHLHHRIHSGHTAVFLLVILIAYVKLRCKTNRAYLRQFIDHYLVTQWDTGCARPFNRSNCKHVFEDTSSSSPPGFHFLASSSLPNLEPRWSGG